MKSYRATLFDATELAHLIAGHDVQLDIRTPCQRTDQVQSHGLNATANIRLIVGVNRAHRHSQPTHKLHSLSIRATNPRTIVLKRSMSPAPSNRAAKPGLPPASPAGQSPVREFS